MAVAIKKHGFSNIKIYNGGLKDWRKSGNPLKSTEALPDYPGAFITAEELAAIVAEAAANGCRDAQDRPWLTLLDLRTEHTIQTAKSLKKIKTDCPTLTMLLDQLRDPNQRARIPQEGLVVTVSETGNRDLFALKYLYLHGYENIQGLKFGMRGWLKADHPTE